METILATIIMILALPAFAGPSGTLTITGSLPPVWTGQKTLEYPRNVNPSAQQNAGGLIITQDAPILSLCYFDSQGVVHYGSQSDPVFQWKDSDSNVIYYIDAQHIAHWGAPSNPIDKQIDELTKQVKSLEAQVAQLRLQVAKQEHPSEVLPPPGTTIIHSSITGGLNTWAVPCTANIALFGVMKGN